VALSWIGEIAHRPRAPFGGSEGNGRVGSGRQRGSTRAPPARVVETRTPAGGTGTAAVARVRRRPPRPPGAACLQFWVASRTRDVP